MSESPNNTPIVDTQPDNNTQSNNNVTPTPKYSKSVIKVVGLDSCGHCRDVDNYIRTEIIPNADVPIEYAKVDAKSPEGQLIVEEKKLKHVPFVEQCLIPSKPDEKPQCSSINEFRKDFFKSKVNQ